MELKISINIEKVEIQIQNSPISIQLGMEGGAVAAKGERESPRDPEGGSREQERGEGAVVREEATPRERKEERRDSSNSPEVVAELLEWLEGKGFQVRNYSTGEEIELLARIAEKLGEKYQLLKPLYLRLKSKLGKGGEFQLEMKEYPSVQISEILNFCKQLQDLGFLEYTYRNSPYFLLRGFVHPNPVAINLLSGHWLEKWGKRKLLEELRGSGLKYGYLQELQVTLPDGKDDEFDLLFSIEGERVVVECKTASFDEKIQKFAERSGRFLEIPPERRVLLLLEATPEQRQSLKEIYQVEVESLESFPERVKEIVAGIKRRKGEGEQVEGEGSG